MPQIPETIRSFLIGAYNPQLVELIEKGRSDLSDTEFVNHPQFANDIFSRTADALRGNGIHRFTDDTRPTAEQLTALADWMKNIAPRGIDAYKAYLLDFESCGPREAQMKQRAAKLIQEYYPEGYAVIFGE